MLTIPISKHIVFSVVAKIFQIGAQLYFLALITKAFDKQDMGLWLLFFHSIFFFSFFDMGLGGTFLQSRLASFQGSKSLLDQAQFFFATFFQTLILYFIAFGLLSLFSQTLTQQFFCNVKYAPLQIQQVFLIFAFLQLMRFPLNFWAAALISSDKSYLKSTFEILENLGAAALITLVFIYKAPLFMALISFSFFSFFVSLICFFLTAHNLGLSCSNITFDSLFANPLNTLKNAFPFWLQNILSTFLFSLSPFMFNRSFGMELGSDYILSLKICSLVVGVHLASLAPLTPCYRRLYALNRQSQALAHLLKAFCFTMIFLVVISCMISMFAQPMLKLWAKREVIFYFSLLPWMILYCLINVLSIYLNSLEKVSCQNIFLLLGLAIFSLSTLIFNLSEKMFCLASSFSIIPLFIANLLQVAPLKTYYNPWQKKLTQKKFSSSKSAI